MVVIALIGLYQLWHRGPGVAVAIAAALLLAEGIFEVIHIQNVVARYTLEGVQLDHVGWGVYAVIVGAAATLAAAWRQYRAR